MAKEYSFNIEALINAKDTSTNTQNTNGNINTLSNNLSGYKTMNSLAMLSAAHYASRQINKIGSTFGSNQFQSFSRNTSILARYGMKVGQAMTGNPVAIVDLVLDVACDLGQQVRKLQQEQAAKLNEQDVARIKAGVLNIDDTVVTTSWWDGRYKYNGGE